MAFSGKTNLAKKRAQQKQPLDETALYAYALYSLGRKMRTVAELKRLMRRRVEPGESGESKMAAVVARLIDNKYLNDARYAADYTRMRQENEKFGRRRVQQDLMQRGVKSEIVGATLDVAYADLPEADLARRYIERKRLRKPTNDKETARIVRSLVRAGFSLGTIFPLLKSWNVEDSTIEALSDADMESAD